MKRPSASPRNRAAKRKRLAASLVDDQAAALELPLNVDQEDEVGQGTDFGIDGDTGKI